MSSEAVLDYFTRGCIIGFIVLQSAILLIVFSNVWLMRRRRVRAASDSARFAEKPFVSLLVPARNEEANIRACVRALLAQDYPSFELIVLDDQSEDSTLLILEEERAGDSRLTVLVGDALPDGWVGKNWACHQLSLAAHGDILFFADADTVAEPNAVEAIVKTLHVERADLLSGMPRQVVGSFGEKVLVPILPWCWLSFSPLLVGRLWPRAAIARAVGQIMVFTRDAYDAIGGHVAVRESVVEDVALSMRIRRAGRVLRLVDVTGLVSCRMYRGGREAYEGFSKNLFAVFDHKLLPYAFVWIYLGYVHVEPFVALGLHLAFPESVPWHPALLATTVALALVHWVFTYAYFKLPLWPALLYPLTMLVFDAVAFRSFVRTLSRTTSWKGRSLVRPPIRPI
jgi:chlorobactene glucosyltransferase